MKRYGWLILILALSLIMIFPACAKKSVAPPIEEVEPVEEVPPPPPPEEIEVIEEEPVIIEEIELPVLEDVFFEFDKFTIQDMYKEILADNADMLMENPDANLLIEGHCDERGTNEYNLSLGEKRAKAVMDFYIAYGVGAGRLTIISYGEEKPFDPGHNEAAWAKNRRAHMVVR